jgi:hypothetical protein
MKAETIAPRPAKKPRAPRRKMQNPRILFSWRSWHLGGLDAKFRVISWCQCSQIRGLRPNFHLARLAFSM